MKLKTLLENKNRLLSKEHIIFWLNRMSIRNYTINSDLTVDVENDVVLRNVMDGYIPIKFGNVSGNFDCSYKFSVIDHIDI